MSDTYHSEHPDVWRTHHAIETLTKTRWADIAATIDNAARQARHTTATSHRDGYPAASLGDSGGTSELTSVEAAANANLYGRTTHEQESLFDLVRDARALLSEAGGIATQLKAKVETIRQLLDQAELELNPCDLCGATHNRQRFGDVGGRLPVSRRLCADGNPPCYDVVKRNGGWPTDEQRAHFERTGKWIYRATRHGQPATP